MILIGIRPEKTKVDKSLVATGTMVYTVSIMKMDQRINVRLTKKQMNKLRLLAYKWKCSRVGAIRLAIEKA